MEDGSQRKRFKPTTIMKPDDGGGQNPGTMEEPADYFLLRSTIQKKEIPKDLQK